MASAIGELLIRLGLDASEYTSGLSKAEYLAQQSSQRIKESFLGTFAGNFAAGVTKEFTDQLAALPAKVAGFVKDAIDAADHLNDLSKKTGIAVEELGGLGFAAKQAGGDLESIADATVKLDRNLAQAGAGGKQQAAVFASMGLSALDSSKNVKTADVALKEIADKFAGYADGANKTALAIALFGKAGAAIIPLLNDGGAALQANIDYFKRYGGVTAEVAAQADQFNDTLEKVRLLQGAFARTLASDLLPVLQLLADKFVSAKESGDGFAGTSQQLTEFFGALLISAESLGTVINQLVRSVGALGAAAGVGFGAVVDAVANFVTLHPVDAFNDLAAGTRQAGTVLKEYATDAVKAANASDAFGDAVRRAAGTAKDAASLAANAKNAIHSAGDLARADRAGVLTVVTPKITKPDAPAPVIKTGGSTGKADDPTKKLLDNDLKEIQANIAATQAALQTRNKFIDQINQQDTLSLASYYAFKQGAANEALTATLASYDQEIKALQTYRDTKGRSQKDIADADGKIADAERKREKATRDAADASTTLSLQQTAAVKKLADQFNTLTASVLDYREQFGKAAAIKFDQSNEGLTKQFTAEGNAQALANLQTLRAAAIAQGQYQEVANASSRTYATLQQQEAALNAAVSTGSATTLGALAAIGEARRAQIPLIEAQVQAQEAIAKADGSAALVANAQAARAALEQLKAAADPLADKFREIGVSATENFIDKLASGTVKLKDAFKGLADDIGKQFLKLAEQNIAESLFGKGGVLGSIAPALSKAFTPAAKSGVDPSLGGTVTGIAGPLNGTSTGSTGGDLFTAFLAKLGIGGSTSGTGAASKAATGALGDATSASAASTALSSVTTAATPLSTILTELTTSATTAATALSTVGSGAATDAGEGLLKGAETVSGDGDAGGIFGSLLGDGGGAAGAAEEALAATEVTTAFTAIVSAATPLVSVFIELLGTATAASTALASVAASQGASEAGSLVKIAGAAAVASSQGNVFDKGSAIPFMRGGAFVNRKSYFGMADGRTGSISENGPEAIMPLKRNASGDLGVAMEGMGGGGNTINLNYYPAQGESRQTTTQRGAELYRQGMLANSRVT